MDDGGQGDGRRGREGYAIPGGPMDRQVHGQPLRQRRQPLVGLAFGRFAGGRGDLARRLDSVIRLVGVRIGGRSASSARTSPRSKRARPSCPRVTMKPRFLA